MEHIDVGDVSLAEDLNHVRRDDLIDHALLHAASILRPAHTTPIPHEASSQGGIHAPRKSARGVRNIIKALRQVLGRTRSDLTEDHCCLV